MTKIGKIRCTIERGAFSGERVVTVRTKFGELTSVAPVSYCTTQTGEALNNATPMKDEQLDGFLNVSIFLQGRHAYITLPSGESFLTSESDVHKLMEE